MKYMLDYTDFNALDFFRKLNLISSKNTRLLDNLIVFLTYSTNKKAKELLKKG